MRANSVMTEDGRQGVNVGEVLRRPAEPLQSDCGQSTDASMNEQVSKVLMENFVPYF